MRGKSSTTSFSLTGMSLSDIVVRSIIRELYIEANFLCNNVSKIVSTIMKGGYAQEKNHLAYIFLWRVNYDGI